MSTEIQHVRQQWRTDIAERDVMFAMQVFHCHRQLAWCLEHLRQHYEIARVVLINDGDGELVRGTRGEIPMRIRGR